MNYIDHSEDDTLSQMDNNTPSAKSHSIYHQSHGIVPSSVLIVVVPIIIIILLFAILLLIVMLRRIQFSRGSNAGIAAKSSSVIDRNCSSSLSHRTINISSSPEIDGGCLQGGNVGRSARTRGVQVFTLKEAEAATNGFHEGNLIGNESQGMVYKGVLRDGTVVAIKTLHGQGRQGERSFRLQVDMLSQLCSPYIVALLGYCADQHHRLLVFEHMPNGNLQDSLHYSHERYTRLNWGIRLRIALDCARALEYLHEKATPSVIHRNFKCSSVFLDHNLRSKLSGFELARTGSHKLNGLVSTRVLGTTGYMAPEYALTGKLTTKSDVYSYGIFLLELLTGRMPVDTNRPAGEHVLVSWALPHLTNRDKVVEMLDPDLENQFVMKDLVQVAAIASMCVQDEADYRPLMTDVVQSLIPLVKNLSHVLCYSNPNSLLQSSTARPRP